MTNYNQRYTYCENCKDETNPEACKECYEGSGFKANDEMMYKIMGKQLKEMENRIINGTATDTPKGILNVAAENILKESHQLRKDFGEVDKNV